MGLEGEYKIRVLDSESKNAGDVEDEWALHTLALRAGVIAREGNKWMIRTEERSFPKRETLMTSLETDLGLKHRVREATFSVLL